MAIDPERLSTFKKTLLIAILIGIISGFGSLLFFVGLKAAVGFVASIVLGYQTVGPLFLTALKNQDMFLGGSILLILSLLTVIGTLVSDILLVILDPRLRS